MIAVRSTSCQPSRSPSAPLEFALGRLLDHADPVLLVLQQLERDRIRVKACIGSIVDEAALRFPSSRIRSC
jgi:hypothetical protein